MISQPPMLQDRVGIVRKLSLNDTLKKEDDVWRIDLTKERAHKTAKFYGECACLIAQVASRTIPVYRSCHNKAL